MTVGLLRALEGHWRGEGIGEYPPTIAPFKCTVDFIIRPLSSVTWEFRSETKTELTCELMSLEFGTFRCKPIQPSNGKIELSTLHALSSVTEISQGNYSDDSIEVCCRNEGLCHGDFSAQPRILEIRRVFELKRTHEGKEFLEILVEKATTETPMQSYLVARLFQIR